MEKLDLRNYFVDAQDEANDNFFNYDGDDFDDFDEYDEFEDDDFDGDDYFEGDDDDAFDMATGGGGNTAPTSQPYIVVVKNTTTLATDETPATILGAYNTLANSSANWQNAVNISITMGISGITYSEFLYQSMNKPFVVGLTYYQSSTANQVLETITLISRDVNGNESQKTLVPTIDPYQQQSTVIAIKYSYKIDGFTSLVLNCLGGSTTKLYFYPAETASTARTLTGKRSVAGYGNPNIIKSDKLTLSGSAVRALKGGRRRGRGRRGRYGRRRRLR